MRATRARGRSPIFGTCVSKIEAERMALFLALRPG